jgi:hypothetical protein
MSAPRRLTHRRLHPVEVGVVGGEAPEEVALRIEIIGVWSFRTISLISIACRVQPTARGVGGAAITNSRTTTFIGVR